MKLKDIKDLLPKELHDDLCGEEWCNGRNEILYKMGLLELEIDVERVADLKIGWDSACLKCGTYNICSQNNLHCKGKVIEVIAKECPIKVKE